jgi:hypothetical protein
LLEPYGDLPVAPSFAVVSFGCVHHWLGIAARATKRPELAERHLRAAVDTNLRHGHVPATAAARAELASILSTHHPTPAREAEARLLLAAALNTAEEVGMATLADRWRDTAHRLDESARVRLARADQSGRGGWVVDFAGRQATVRNLAGIRMLAMLTAAPKEWVPAGLLATGQLRPVQVVPAPLLDAAARRDLESRMRELATTVAHAREQGELTAQAAAEEELDAIAEHLSSATGLSGRGRRFPDENERARTSVRKAIMRAIQEIETHHPTAAEHLRNHVVTGARCRYG